MSDALQQLQALAGQAGFAKLSSDVELPVVLDGVRVYLMHVELAHVWEGGKPTEDIRVRQHVDEDTGEITDEVQARCTVQLRQGAGDAPARLNGLWMSIEDATALVRASQEHAPVELVNARVVPFKDTKQKAGSTFVDERAALRWHVDGVKLV